jgi:hypothetical protein
LDFVALDLVFVALDLAFVAVSLEFVAPGLVFVAARDRDGGDGAAAIGFKPNPARAFLRPRAPTREREEAP